VRNYYFWVPQFEKKKKTGKKTNRRRGRKLQFQIAALNSASRERIGSATDLGKEGIEERL